LPASVSKKGGSGKPDEEDDDETEEKESRKLRSSGAAAAPAGVAGEEEEAKAVESGKADGEDEGAGRRLGEDLVNDGAVGNGGNAGKADGDAGAASGGGNAGKAAEEAEAGADVMPLVVRLAGGGSFTSSAVFSAAFLPSVSFSSFCSSLSTRDRDPVRPKVMVSDESECGAEGLGVSSDVGAGAELGAAGAGLLPLGVFDFISIWLSDVESEGEDEEAEDDDRSGVGGKAEEKDDSDEDEDEDEDEAVRKEGRKERSSSAAGCVEGKDSALIGCVNAANGTAVDGLRAGDAGVGIGCESADWKLENSANSSSSSPSAWIGVSGIGVSACLSFTSWGGCEGCAGAGRSGCRMPGLGDCTAALRGSCRLASPLAVRCIGVSLGRTGDWAAASGISGDPPLARVGVRGALEVALVDATVAGRGCRNCCPRLVWSTFLSPGGNVWVRGDGDRRGAWILASTSGGSGGRSSVGTTGAALTASR
jgi:hypothetical protein